MEIGSLRVWLVGRRCRVARLNCIKICFYTSQRLFQSRCLCTPCLHPRRVPPCLYIVAQVELIRHMLVRLASIANDHISSLAPYLLLFFPFLFCIDQVSRSFYRLWLPPPHQTKSNKGKWPPSSSLIIYLGRLSESQQQGKVVDIAQKHTGGQQYQRHRSSFQFRSQKRGWSVWFFSCQLLSFFVVFIVVWFFAFVFCFSYTCHHYYYYTIAREPGEFVFCGFSSVLLFFVLFCLLFHFSFFVFCLFEELYQPNVHVSQLDSAQSMID